MSRPRSSRRQVLGPPGFEGNSTQEIDYSSRSVLVVDDEPDLREALADLLVDQGFMVMTAASGRDALELLAACRPAVVVLDVMMPIMNGIELLEIMKKEPALSCIPVLLVTASHNIGQGDVPLFHKPVDVDRLISAIRACIEPRRQLSQAG